MVASECCKVNTIHSVIYHKIKKESPVILKQILSVLYLQVNAYNAKRQLAVNNVARAYGASDGTAFAYGVPGANNVAYKGAGYGNPGGSFLCSVALKNW